MTKGNPRQLRAPIFPSSEGVCLSGSTKPLPLGATTRLEMALFENELDASPRVYPRDKSGTERVEGIIPSMG